MSHEYEPDEDPIVTADDIAEEASGRFVVVDEDDQE